MRVFKSRYRRKRKRERGGGSYWTIIGPGEVTRALGDQSRSMNDDGPALGDLLKQWPIMAKGNCVWPPSESTIEIESANLAVFPFNLLLVLLLLVTCWGHFWDRPYQMLMGDWTGNCLSREWQICSNFVVRGRSWLLTLN